MMDRRRLLIAALGCAAVAGCADSGSRSRLRGVVDSGDLVVQGFGRIPRGGTGASGTDETAAARLRMVGAAYPKVHVRIDQSDVDAQRLRAAVVGASPPDLVYVDRQLIGTFAQQGLIQPLTDLIADANLDMRQYRDQVLLELIWNAEFYGVPEFFQTRAVVLAPAVLDKAGVAVSDLSTRDWGRLATAAEAVGFDPGLPDFLPLWARVNGADLVHPDGGPNLDDPKVIGALDFTAGLAASPRGRAFAEGRLGAAAMEHSQVNGLLQAGTAMTAAPFIDREGQVAGWATGAAWAIPRGARNPRVAIRFVRAMTRAATWVHAAAARHRPFTGLLTANLQADEMIKDQFLTRTPNLSTVIGAYNDDLDRTFAIPSSPVGEEIRRAWRAAVASVLKDRSNPALALKAAQRTASADYAAAR